MDSPEIVNEIFQLREESHYNLRFKSIHSVYNITKSVSYLGPKIWELIPPVIWQIDTFSGFKKVIKNGNLPTPHTGFEKHTYLT